MHEYNSLLAGKHLTAKTFSFFSPEHKQKFTAEDVKLKMEKEQRQFCGCIVSKDIGEYNTCPHLCEYCYANANKNIALTNWDLHKQNPINKTIK